jgi:hypothetical protein
MGTASAVVGRGRPTPQQVRRATAFVVTHHYGETGLRDALGDVDPERLLAAVGGLPHVGRSRAGALLRLTRGLRKAEARELACLLLVAMARAHWLARRQSSPAVSQSARRAPCRTAVPRRAGVRSRARRRRVSRSARSCARSGDSGPGEAAGSRRPVCSAMAR